MEPLSQMKRFLRRDNYIYLVCCFRQTVKYVWKEQKIVDGSLMRLVVQWNLVGTIRLEDGWLLLNR